MEAETSGRVTRNRCKDEGRMVGRKEKRIRGGKIGKVYSGLQPFWHLECISWAI